MWRERTVTTPSLSPAFYMYTGPELDFGWMRSCNGFAERMRTWYHERLGEVHMRDLLENHPWRTHRAADATLFFIPVWEIVSFRIGDCNGTTHSGRMARAARALKDSPYFRARGQRRAGFDHFIVSTGCIEDYKRTAERLGPKLAYALSHAIVGRDRAYNAFYKSSAVGRCVIETPYVANSAEAEDGGDERRWLLSFHGSLDVCCEPGKGLRVAARRLVGASNDSLIIDVARVQYSQAEMEAAYLTQAQTMRDSVFCLVPAGDNEARTCPTKPHPEPRPRPHPEPASPRASPRATPPHRTAVPSHHVR